MGKISDIWVRLGLKKEGYDKGMNDAGKKAEGFGNTLSKVKAGAHAVWDAIGTSVIAFGKKMIETTNAIGDEWGRFTAQAKAEWDTFVQSLSAMNWTDFIGRFREATQAAKELQNALDAEFEISNSIKLQKAAMADELNNLQILMRDVTKPWEERRKAAEKYLEMVRPLYQQEIDLANKLLDAQQGKWLAGSGLADTEQTRNDLTKFLIDYGKTNNSLADSLSQLFALQAQRDVTAKTMMKSWNFKALQSTLERQDAEIAALMEYINAFASQNGYQTDIAKLAKVYETLRGDADTQPLVDALIRAGEAAGAYAGETRKVQSALNTATAALESATETLKEASVTREDLSLPAMTAVQGNAVSMMPDLISENWLETQKQRGLEAVAMQAEWMNIMAEGAMMLEQTLISSLGNGLQAITDLMFGLDGASAKNILAAFMAPFGDFAKQMGAMIMSYGLSMDAFKKASVNPYVAIAAGAGLMAIGAAISSGAQKLSAGSLSGSPTSSYGSSSYNNELNNYESTLTVYVEGRISGSDIIIAGTNQQNKWNR